MRIHKRIIGENQPCYVIAEIGHNHQGEEEKALELVRAAADCGVNAVKFQKRDNASLFSKDFFNSAYNSENSFGKTYGEHREFLEPKTEWLVKANKLAHDLGLDFIMTAFDLESLEFCEKTLEVDAYKIQSADLTFLKLVESVIKTGKPFFLSCGASSLEEIKTTFEFCKARTSNFCLMYTVSSYHTSLENLNLCRLTCLKDLLSFHDIGYSCHYKGNKAAEFARIRGAVAIEKHFTLDKGQKGPDHVFSATPGEMKQLILDLSEIDRMHGANWENETTIEPYQKDARYKMGKCAVANKTIQAGHTLMEEDLVFQSPAKGISPMEIRRYIGKKLHVTIQKDDIVLPVHFEA